MPLPDERPRASVANLIGRFERTAQRRASSGDLVAQARQAQLVVPKGPNAASKDPKSPAADGPAWLKNRERILKEKEERQAAERAQLATQSNIPQAPILVNQPLVEAEGTLVAPNIPVDEPERVVAKPQAPQEALPTSEQSSIETRTELPPNGAIKTVSRSSRSSFATPQSVSRVAKVDSTPNLKSSRSTSALKAVATPPSAFKSMAVQSNKPQPAPLSASTSSPQRTPLSSSRSAGAIRKPKPTSTSGPARAETPQAARPKTPSGMSRPKTPSALYAPTASSLAKLKPPPLPATAPAPKVASKPGSPAKPKVPTTLRTTTTSPTPSGSRNKAPSRPSVDHASAGKILSGKKPLILSAKSTKPTVPGSKVTAQARLSEEQPPSKVSPEEGAASSVIILNPALEDRSESPPIIQEIDGPDASHVIEPGWTNEVKEPEPAEFDSSMEAVEGTEIGNGKTELDMIVSMLEGLPGPTASDMMGS